MRMATVAALIDIRPIVIIAWVLRTVAALIDIRPIVIIAWVLRNHAVKITHTENYVNTAPAAQLHKLRILTSTISVHNIGLPTGPCQPRTSKVQWTSKVVSL